MAAQIPHRSPAREVALEGAATSPSPDQSDAPLHQIDASTESARDDRAIADALAALPDEDRVIIRMRHWDDCSVAEIARALGLEQKPLYRRIERIQAGLAAALAARGVDRQRVEARLAAAGDPT
jgi:RNA polymerase sigma factor (sigma-70 family)